jgi:hypothetical protein
MTQTITRLFTSPADALSAVQELRAAGVSPEAITYVTRNSDAWRDEAAEAGDGRHAEHGLGKGALTGGVVGGLGGLLAGLGLIVAPGLGALVAAGWAAATVAGAGAGAVAGGAIGGLLGALRDAGHSDEEAAFYDSGVTRGGALVSVHAADDQAADIQGMLTRHGGVSAAMGQLPPEPRSFTDAAPLAPDMEAERQEAERAANLGRPSGGSPTGRSL